MTREIHRDDVQTLLGSGANVVEVLSAEEYEREHLSGAINIPLRTLDRDAPRRLRRDQPVIVYCYDYQ